MEGLVEPFCVPDIYSAGIGEVQNLGNGLFRAVYFTYAKVPGSPILERVIVCKIIRHTSSLLNPKSDLAQWVANQRRPEMILHA